MNDYTGRLTEVLLERYKNASLSLALPREAVPLPGQYLQANLLDSDTEAVPFSLFRAGIEPTSNSSPSKEILFWSQTPLTWELGSEIALRGPIGKPFHVPEDAKSIALIAVGNTASTLLPLIDWAHKQAAQVTLFSDSQMSNLPLVVEQQSLDAAAQSREWADYVAVATPRESLTDIPALLDFDPDFPHSINGQVLVLTQMPCGGMAQCGVCHTNLGRKDSLVCESGPIYPLMELLMKV